MDILLLLLLMILVKGLTPRRPDTDPDYMSPASTAGVKGLFVFLVILSHYVSYGTPVPNQAYTQLRSHLDQLVVVMFLFYSGFGMMEQMKKRGIGYVQSIPRRFLTLLIQFDIAVALFGLMQFLLGRTFSLKQWLLAMTGWGSLGNSNWYIFGILCLYVVTFICFQPLRRDGKKSLYLSMGLMLCGSGVLVLAIRHLGKEPWWYNTLLTFPLGMAFSLLRPQVDRLLKHRFTYLAACAAVAVFYVLFSDLRRTSLVSYTLWTFLFAAAVVLFTMKLQLHSPALDYAGSHVFSIYILQRIPMAVFKHFGLTAAHPYLSLMASVVITLLMAELFDHLTGKLTRRLPGKKAA